MVVERAQKKDAAAVLALLEQNQLPVDGLTEHLPTTVVAREDGRVIGSAALEVYEHGALLRSVAVNPAVQGQGLGHALTDAALRMAGEYPIDDVFLLTTTAENFFPKFGFERIARDEVPASVQRSVEFTSACPSTAVVMRKRLR
jgi:amino-acid N-acetyltransferase